MATDIRLKENLSSLTDEIVDTYHDVGTINHLGHCPLPRHHEVVAATEQLKEILYPGYRRREGLHLGNVGFYIGDMVDRLHDVLTTQIARALRHEAGALADCSQEIDFEAVAQEKTVAFLHRIPEVRRQLAQDVQAAYDGDPAAKTLDEVIFCYPGLEAVTVYRLAHALHELEVPLIPRNHDRMGACGDRNRHSPRRHDRRPLFHRPWARAW